MARRISLIVAALICLSSGLASAQERFGGLSGTVTDSSKAAVPGATVTATNRQTGAQRVVVSSGDGTYRVPDLDPGRYSVTIELDTFQKVVVDEGCISGDTKPLLIYSDQPKVAGGQQ